MAQTLWVENEKQFSGGTDVGAKISKRKLKKKIERKKKEMEWRRKTQNSPSLLQCSNTCLLQTD